ncbi:MAG TPA: DUF2891 domain-containing protein, partial [Casimicrobiaceae bacterium]|nr:DUF2891 domain-containing protein [Casimicrobiaceae bacterium]
GSAFPHKLDHVIDGAADLCDPRALHPAFHGSFDWHSCVHMHWLLARIRRRFPGLAAVSAIDELFDRSFSAQSIDGELAYLAEGGRETFERPYGWAWLLKLASELASGTDSQSARWANALAQLAAQFSARYRAFLPRARYPVRHGVHSNSAFGLVFAFDYGRIAHDTLLEDACSSKARMWFIDDRDAPASWEPSGVDFLSPVLIEAHLMRRILSRDAFGPWLTRFLPRLAERSPRNVFEPVVVDDRSDGHLVHLDGLNLSRAWCFRSIADALPPDDPRVAVASQAADLHLTAGLRGLQSNDFAGAHWLASFALLALDGG